MKGRSSLRLAIFSLLLCVVCLPSEAQAGPKTSKRSSVADAATSFERAEADYRRLATQDPEVRDLVEWEKAASRLSQVIDKNPQSSSAPEALFLLGQLYEQTFRKRSFRTGLSKAVYFYERLAKDYQGNPVVPEALLRLGDLRRTGLRDESAARAAYYEIIDRYPKAEAVGTARLRLGPMESTSQKEMEVDTEEVRPPEEGREVFRSEQSIKRPMIVIDPGHGGEELGAVGVGGILEKDVVLQISILLDELLRHRLRARTLLTRTTDTTISLADRSKFANEKQADLFVSIHANASEYKTLRGVETYYLDNTDDKASLKLAERENASLLKSSGDLGFIISDFIQSAKLDESISLAHHLHRNLHQNLARYYSGVRDLGVKKAPFYVLVGAHMPCALIEVSFIDHPIEGERLGNRRYQKLIATGLYLGIKSYFEQRAKDG